MIWVYYSLISILATSIEISAVKRIKISMNTKPMAKHMRKHSRLRIIHHGVHGPSPSKQAITLVKFMTPEFV